MIKQATTVSIKACLRVTATSAPVSRAQRHSRAAAVMTKAKLSQGELVQNALVPSPAPLIDVGVNLVDHAFDKVWVCCAARGGFVVQRTPLYV